MKGLFSIDLRSLGLFRFFLGIVLIFDFFNRFGLVEAFYNDDGIIDRAYLIENIAINWKFTLLNLNGTSLFAHLLAFIGVIFSVLFTIGFRTKFSAIIAWVLLYSFQNRFPMINHGGDNLLRLLLFFSILLPVQARFSIDKHFGKGVEEDKDEISTSFSFLIYLQIFLMYFFTFFYKWHPSWLKELDSLYFAMNIDLYTTVMGESLLNFPNIMKVLSFLTLWVEGIGPLLLFIPWKKTFFRNLALLLFWGLHLGILLTLHLGNFPWACLVLWVPLIPKENWDFLKRKRKKMEKGYTLYYDVDCGFCRRFCLFLKEVLFLEELEILSSDVDKKVFSTINHERSWLLKYNDQSFFRFEAFSKLIEISIFRFLSPVFNLSVVQTLGHWVYQVLSSRRNLLGTLFNKYSGGAIKLKPSKIGSLFAIYIICLSTAWNFEGYLGFKKFDIRDPFTSTAFFLGLNQQWNMFAPKPMSNDGWYVVDGVLKDGKKWNPVTNTEVNFEKPKYLQDTVDGTQWRKFFVNLKASKYKEYRLWYGKYICRKWNSKNKNKLKSFQINFMLERTPKDQSIKPVIKKDTIWNHNCF